MRLWPTRRRFELRHEELLGELARLHRTIDELKAGQAELRTRLRRTQAMTARIYEARHEWPRLLDEARQQPEYELSYTEPEPLISIPVTTYHSPGTLCERALASVRAQTHENWEAIVVGDHCTDDTEQRVRALGDPRITFVNLPYRENEPPDPWEEWAVRGSIPRGVGMDRARGRWIAPMSHDDAWDPDHLSTLLEAGREHRAELVYSRMRRVDGLDPLRSLPSCGTWPPRLGDFGCQASMINGRLKFLRLDRACALASEPNDWNLARRAWEAGVRFHFVDRETVTLYLYPRTRDIADAYAARGLPPEAAAYP